MPSHFVCVLTVCIVFFVLSVAVERRAREMDRYRLNTHLKWARAQGAHIVEYEKTLLTASLYCFIPYNSSRLLTCSLLCSIAGPQGAAFISPTT